MSKIDNISVCEMDCNSCPLYIASINNDLNGIRKILRINDDIEVTIEKNGCLGCHSKINHQILNGCYMRECAYKQNIDSCGKCQNYPCDYLNILSKNTKERLDKINQEFKGIK